MKLTIQEKLCISRLFNKGGYVLDFSSSKFDDFTQECVGIRLTEHYNLSKGASLGNFTTAGVSTQVYRKQPSSSTHSVSVWKSRLTEY